MLTFASRATVWKSSRCLQGYFRSTAALRVQVALEVTGLGVESIPHDLRRGEPHAPHGLRVNPKVLAPTPADLSLALHVQRPPLRANLAGLVSLIEAAAACAVSPAFAAAAPERQPDAVQH